jgi:hypothetical protein
MKSDIRILRRLNYIANSKLQHDGCTKSNKAVLLVKCLRALMVAPEAHRTMATPDLAYWQHAKFFQRQLLSCSFRVNHSRAYLLTLQLTYPLITAVQSPQYRQYG